MVGSGVSRSRVSLVMHRANAQPPGRRKAAPVATSRTERDVSALMDGEAPGEGGRDGRSAAPHRALVLLNHKARSGRLPIGLALDVFAAADMSVEEVVCGDPRETGDVIRSRLGAVDCVIVGGGDGTLNSVAPALVETRIPLGILPLGTANDLARTLAIRPDLAAAARTIVEGRTRDIDVGEVNGHPFFNVASIGFSAELASELTAEAKRRWGTLGYALAGAKLLGRTRPFTAFIEHDGVVERVKTVQISVGNGRYYGGGMAVEETAEPDDGQLNVYSLEIGHWSRLLELAPGPSARNPGKRERRPGLQNHCRHDPHPTGAIRQYRRRTHHGHACRLPGDPEGGARLRPTQVTNTARDRTGRLLMDSILALAAQPQAWAALLTLIVMEVVLGIDNLIFLAILTNKLPEQQRRSARTIGLSLALIMRLGLLGTISFIVALTAPVITILGNELSWRDLILIAGGLFLIWKATREIHETLCPQDATQTDKVVSGFASAIMQIIVLDLVFSVDSIITAVGMTDHLPIMFAAVIVAVVVMAIAASPLATFIKANPTIVMLALGFLLMIGTTLIADGLGYHVPKGYIYTAMAFSAGVETLNMLTRRAGRRQQGGESGEPAGSRRET